MEKSDIRTGTPLIASAIAVAAMLAVSAWAWNAIPAGVHVATHWDIHGRPNGFMSKPAALLVQPLIALVLSLLFAALPTIEPRRAHLLASRKLYFAGWYGMLAVLGATHVLTVMTAMGRHVDIITWVTVAVAALGIVIGNFLGKSRSTFFIGLRLPWTLSSELAWEKSNRLLGRIYVATGIATLLVLPTGGPIAAISVFVAGTVLGSIAAGIASYFYWKHDPAAHSGDSVGE